MSRAAVRRALSSILLWAAGFGAPTVHAAPPPATPQVWRIPPVPVPGRAYRTLAFKPVSGFSIFTLAPDGRIFLACQSGPDPKVFGLCLLDPSAGIETLLVEATEHTSLGGALGEDDWLVYARLDEPQRVIAQRLSTHEQLEVGRLSASRTTNPLGPVYALSGSRIVWVDQARGPPPDGDRKRVETVMLFDLQKRSSRSLVKLPPEFVVDQLSLDGETLVYSELDTHDERNVKSYVQLQDLRTGATRRLSQGERASMPRVSGRYVVWKTATHFSYGGIELYDLKANTGKEIATIDPRAHRGYDMPSISPRGVTWLSANNEQIGLYHPETGATEVLERGGGRATIAGHYLAWINDSVGQKSDWHLEWSDLSAPAPTPSR